MSHFRTSEIFRDSRRTLIAVDSVESLSSKSKNTCYFHGMIQPVAVVVCSPDAIYALDMSAMPVAINRLRETVPELDDILAAFDGV